MKHNSYRDANIQNLVFTDSESEKSVGVIEPGKYSLTSEKEEMIQCLTGLLKINDKQYLPGQKVKIPADETFTISTTETSSYLCSYK